MVLNSDRPPTHPQPPYQASAWSYGISFVDAIDDQTLLVILLRPFVHAGMKATQGLDELVAIQGEVKSSIRTSSFFKRAIRDVTVGVAGMDRNWVPDELQLS